MSNPYIWGNLNRAVNDETLIDEAIGEAITAHNDNPDAHLGDEQALQSHRAAEIIDHLAESVVNDKIRAGARSFIAIVGTEDGDDYSKLEDAVDYAWSQGGGSIKVRKGVYICERPLKIRYGVDIYGEGPNETVIDLDSNFVGGLNYAQLYSLSPVVVPSFLTYEGESYVEATGDGLDDVSWLIDCYYKGIPSTSGDDGFFDSVPYPGSLAIDGECLSSDLIEDVEIIPTLSNNASSDIVHVNGWQLFEGYEAFIGLTLSSDSHDYGVVLDYLGDGDFKVDVVIEDATWRDIGVRATGDTGRLSILQGVTVKMTYSDSAIIAAGDGSGLYIRDSLLDIGSRLFKEREYYSMLAAPGVRIENCVVRAVGWCEMNTSGAKIRNSGLRSQGGGVVFNNLGGIDAVFENCSFGDGLDTEIANIDHYTNFNNCTFANSLRGTVTCGGEPTGTIPQPHIFFSNSSILITGSGGLAMYGYGIIVVGCFFYGGGGTIGLHSSSRYSTFSCNVIRNTIATTPTNCVAVGNIQMP